MIQTDQGSGHKDYLAYGIVALILAFVCFIILTFVFNIIAIAFRLMIKYYVWVIILLVIVLIIKWKRRKRSTGN